MKMNKSIVFVIIMALILSAYIFFTLIIYARKTPAPYKEEGPAEIAQAPQIYSIPENAIPTVKEIEGTIEKTRKEKEEREGTIKQKRTAAPRLYSENQQEPEEKDKPPKPQTTAVIPKKKEVKFPTYEERKASKSQGSICVY